MIVKELFLRGHHNETIFLLAPYIFSYLADGNKKLILGWQKICTPSCGKLVLTIFLSCSACSWPSEFDFPLLQYTLNVKASVFFWVTFFPDVRDFSTCCPNHNSFYELDHCAREVTHYTIGSSVTIKTFTMNAIAVETNERQPPVNLVP